MGSRVIKTLMHRAMIGSIHGYGLTHSVLSPSSFDALYNPAVDQPIVYSSREKITSLLRHKWIVCTEFKCNAGICPIFKPKRWIRISIATYGSFYPHSIQIPCRYWLGGTVTTQGGSKGYFTLPLENKVIKKSIIIISIAKKISNKIQISILSSVRSGQVTS